MKLWTILALGTFLLVGCFEEEEEALPYPPLDPRALVGCWKEIKPLQDCASMCFDRAGGYFLSRQFVDRKLEIREDSGVYSISKNDLSVDRILRTSLDRRESNFDGFHFTIINGTLQSTDPLGASSFTRVHPDSFPCGLKPWTLFRKPAGWDSLVKPY